MISSLLKALKMVATNTLLSYPHPVRSWLAYPEMPLARIATAISAAMLLSSIAWAHTDSGYNSGSAAVGSRADWMKDLDDNLLLSQLSIPGTHDTMANCPDPLCPLYDQTRTQSMGLLEQLNSGIRALDVRLAYEEIGGTDLIPLYDVTSSSDCEDDTPEDKCRFFTYHGFVWQGGTFEEDVRPVLEQFLIDNPTEAIVMRIKKDQGSNGTLFDTRMAALLSSYRDLFVDKTCNPSANTIQVRLGDGTQPCDARGKVSVLYQHSDGTIAQPQSIGSWTALIPAAQKQDVYSAGFTTNWDLYAKWELVKAHLGTSNEGDPSTAPASGKLYANFLSAAYPAFFPYFVASGHSSSWTSAPRLSTGLTTPGWDSSYPDFPRTTCVWLLTEVCTISFEGTNTLAKNRIIWVTQIAPIYCQAGLGYCGTANAYANPRFGLVMADFPGAGLIDALIMANSGNVLPATPPNVLPTALLDEESYEVNEGSPITSDGGGSSDSDGGPQPLEYSWALTGLDDNCERIASDAEELEAYNTALAAFAVSNPDLADNELIPAFLATPEGALAAANLAALSPDPSQATYHCLDDGAGTVTLEVTDGEATDDDSASLTVVNVAPSVLVTDVTFNENEVASVDLTVTDPGTLDTFTLGYDWGDGSAVESKTLGTSVIGMQTASASHRYLDNRPATASSAAYDVAVTVTDDDSGTGNGNGSVTVLNVSPTVSAVPRAARIQEDDVAVLDVTIVDPGTLDTFSVEIDWGDGSAKETFSKGASSAGSQTFSRNHRYLDDKPSTTDDDYDVKVKVVDKDGGEGEIDTTVTVENVDPVSSIDSVVDETGNALGGGVSVVLAGLELGILVSYTDRGTLDMHTVSINWGDGSSASVHGGASSPVVDSHTYATPGNYNLLVTVTDDDGGTTASSISVPVVDSAGATANAITGIAELLDDPQLDPEVSGLIRDALDKLNGDNGGAATNGAVDKYSAEEVNAALRKLLQAFDLLSETPSSMQQRYAPLVSQLALSAKAAVLDAIASAKAVATTPEEWGNITAAEREMSRGDQKLQDGDAAGAVKLYRKALSKL